LAADAVHERGVAPDAILVLTSTRQAAERLRDRVSAAMGRPTAGSTVRSAASVGWSILRAAAIEAGEPPPMLVTGAEQDEILRDLLVGHRVGRVSGPSWEGIVLPEATSLAGFRHELRDLLMRAEEADLGPEDLRRLGETCGRPEWVAAASIFEEYERNLGLRRTAMDQGARYDPAGMVSAAADALSHWAVAPGRPSWDLVIVDDAQDATRATWRLVRTMARTGAQAVLIGNADEAVQGFRGAAPHVLAGAVLAEPDGLSATVLRLGESHRQVEALAVLSARIAERIGTSLDLSARAAPRGDVDQENTPVEVIVSPSAPAEARALAARLRDVHRGDDGVVVSWSDMAVIARTRALAREVRSGLMAEGVPCASLGEGVALHIEPAVAPLLRLARASLGEAWTVEVVEDILGSRAVGLDPPSIRRLRRRLIREERSGGGTRTGGALLVDALEDPARLATIPGRESARAALVARAVGDGRVAAAEGVAAGGILWAIWRRLGVAEAWREAALVGSAIDDADLDAVVALFEAATRHAERLPDASPESFFAYLEGQGFAVDTLAARGTLGDVVSVETPASVAGQEWEIVAIAGLDEGTWPNLRLRDSIFGSVFLSEVLSGRIPETPVPEGRMAEVAHAARVDVLADETRAFHVAFTRAKGRVIALARGGEDERPSRYASWIDGQDHERRCTAEEIGGVSSLREAVVVLRAEATGLPTEGRIGHVAMLARLAAAGVPGADPFTWHGVPEPSSQEPLWAVDQAVRVSPSKVESIESCPLRAVLQSAGGSRESGEAQRLGTLIHAIAAEYPNGSKQELRAALLKAWPDLGLPENWLGSHERDRAGRMVERLA
ncbi:MAG: UvrD-helicase domain-containing protein, partial [Demequinaceae bacterium]|nr:UvrD-helicase domain-containing protein [Demequinaceae bacterium]